MRGDSFFTSFEEAVKNVKTENAYVIGGAELYRPPKSLPQMAINPEIKDIFGFYYDDFKVKGYDPHPAIKAPVAV